MGSLRQSVEVASASMRQRFLLAVSLAVGLAACNPTMSPGGNAGTSGGSAGSGGRGGSSGKHQQRRRRRISGRQRRRRRINGRQRRQQQHRVRWQRRQRRGVWRQRWGRWLRGQQRGRFHRNVFDRCGRRGSGSRHWQRGPDGAGRSLRGRQEVLRLRGPDARPAAEQPRIQGGADRRHRDHRHHEVLQRQAVDPDQDPGGHELPRQQPGVLGHREAAARATICTGA